MLCRKAVSLFVVSLLALVNGMPGNMENGSENPSSLPFIQLTNGGIRFNFAGYHAQAGLGGLAGSSPGGGLHASFGTPWGGHASAGLGGSLNGNNANAGGGLYARAGLGNGRPEAAAGLGGVLDGSGSGPMVRGGLYAGATTGAYGAGVTAGIPNVGPNTGPNNGPNNRSNNRTNDGNRKEDTDEDDGGKPNIGRSNIQIIARSGNKKEKVLQTVAVPAESPEAAKQLDSSPNKETHEVPGVEPLPVVELAPILSNDVKEIAQIGNPRRARLLRTLRKRLWGPRKQIVVEHAAAIEPQDVADTHIQKVHKRQTISYSDPKPRRPPEAVKTDGSFFDDVFEIPRSTLNAVNRLLNNNYG